MVNNSFILETALAAPLVSTTLNRDHDLAEPQAKSASRAPGGKGLKLVPTRIVKDTGNRPAVA
jgi:hypothetical protein